MKQQTGIGIFGGTFDPVHFGHLRTAFELYHTLPVKEIRFIPCQQPVLKTAAYASPAQRLAMLQLAIADRREFTFDDREIKRDTPSFMVDTLASLKQDYPDNTLYLIIGMDAFNEFEQWHRWQEILTLAHLVVVNRPGNDPNLHADVMTLLTQRSCHDLTKLMQQTSGLIYQQRVTPLMISATAIRELIKLQQIPRYLLPENVWEYIQREKLYIR